MSLWESALRPLSAPAAGSYLGSTAGEVMHLGCASKTHVFDQFLLLYSSMRDEGVGTGVLSCVYMFNGTILLFLPSGSQEVQFRCNPLWHGTRQCSTAQCGAPGRSSSDT